MKKALLIIISILLALSLISCNAKTQTPASEAAASLTPEALETVEEPPTQEPETEALPTKTPGIETVTEQEMTLDFSFGELSGIYTGEVSEGLPDGSGTFTFKDTEEENGWYYEGNWRNGHFEGQGTTVWDDGSKETGEYAGDQLNGQGKYYWEDILLYDGQFQNGTYHGQGTLYNYHNEMMYSGNFVNGYFQESPEQREARLAPFKQACQELPYEEYYLSAENQTGEKIKISGRIFQVYKVDETEPYFCDFLMYADDNKEQIVQVFYRLNEGEPLLLDNQTVTVYGTAEWLYAYTSKSDEDKTVPNVQAWSVE